MPKISNLELPSTKSERATIKLAFVNAPENFESMSQKFVELLSLDIRVLDLAISELFKHLTEFNKASFAASDIEVDK